MSDQLAINLRAHDLPPRWDGHPVEWEPWQKVVNLCGTQPEPCASCGSVAGLVTTTGVRTYAADRNVIAMRSRTSGRTARRDLLAALVVTRCVDCRHDTVWDPWTDEWWDLDDSDYQTAGSYAEAGADRG